MYIIDFYRYLSTEEQVKGIQVREPSADSLQSTHSLCILKVGRFLMRVLFWFFFDK
jgi:hypothetical protein